MSGPVVFTLGDKDYIAKLNQMSQQAGDVQAAKTAAEAARTQAQQAVTNATNAGAAEVAKAAAHAANAQAIAQSGLPNQSGMAGRVFKSNGATANWELETFTTAVLTANTTVNRQAPFTTILVDTRSADVTITLNGFQQNDRIDVVKLFAARRLTLSSTVAMTAPDGTAETNHTLTNVAGQVELFRGPSVFTMAIF